MATLTMSRRWAVALVAALLVAGGLVAACSSNNTNPQPAPVYQVGNDSGTDGTTPSGDSAPGPDAPQTEPDGGLQDGQVLPDAPEDAVACTTDAGCWSCLPTTTPQFLNQCTASQCSPFANAQRLPDYDGSLPPLQ
jgi:hypothetical protein